MPKSQSILSWNVNGIRAVLKKGFESFINENNYDIICLQETKISEDLVDDLHFELYPNALWNCADKKGYSGTVILCKEKPISVNKGIGIEKHDKEGRVISAEFPNFILVNVYTPNAQNHGDDGRPKRLYYRCLEWDVDFLNYILILEKTKPVIVCGDLNVAHHEIDLANPKKNRNNAGFTDEERGGFQALVDAGFLDIYRQRNPNKAGAYSWWSYRANARARNIGWRIDYFCISKLLESKVSAAEILPSIMGSDHCPISMTIKA